MVCFRKQTDGKAHFVKVLSVSHVKWPSNHLSTNHLLFHLHADDLPGLLSPTPPPLLLISRWHVRLHCLIRPSSPILMEPPYVIHNKFVYFLLLICIMLT